MKSDEKIYITARNAVISRTNGRDITMPFASITISGNASLHAVNDVVNFLKKKSKGIFAPLRNIFPGIVTININQESTPTADIEAAKNTQQNIDKWLDETVKKYIPAPLQEHVKNQLKIEDFKLPAANEYSDHLIFIQKNALLIPMTADYMGLFKLLIDCHNKNTTLVPDRYEANRLVSRARQSFSTPDLGYDYLKLINYLNNHISACYDK